jgi:hypothetical protein
MKSPFKFLDSYQAEDYDRFFGRDKEAAQLYNALFASNLTVLYGASGTGKTSLVRCGLVGRFLDSDWLPLFVRREENINRALERGVFQALKPGTRERAGDPGGHPVEEMLSRLYFDFYRPLYLIFDQYEELYTVGADVQATVLLVLREEYFGYLNEFEKVVPAIFDNRLRLEKMNDHNLSRVIYSTLKHEGIDIEEPGVTIAAILNNLRQKNREIELTDLQVYLDRLFQKADARGGDPDYRITFSPELVRSLGRMENVLADFLDEQLEQLERELKAKGLTQRGLPNDLLLALITDEGTRNAETIDRLRRTLAEKKGIAPEYIDFLIRRFFEIRILRRKM